MKDFHCVGNCDMDDGGMSFTEIILRAEDRLHAARMQEPLAFNLRVEAYLEELDMEACGLFAAAQMGQNFVDLVFWALDVLGRRSRTRA